MSDEQIDQTDDVVVEDTQPVAGTAEAGARIPTGEGLPRPLGRGRYVIDTGSDDDDEFVEFDPSDHSVEDVLVYLAQEGIDDAEVTRVLDLERAGKARVTLLKHFDD